MSGIESDFAKRSLHLRQHEDALHLNQPLVGIVSPSQSNSHKSNRFIQITDGNSRLSSNKNVLATLIKVAEELNFAHAQYEYMKESKQQNLTNSYQTSLEIFNELSNGAVPSRVQDRMLRDIEAMDAAKAMAEGLRPPSRIAPVAVPAVLANKMNTMRWGYFQSSPHLMANKLNVLPGQLEYNDAPELIPRGEDVVIIPGPVNKPQGDLCTDIKSLKKKKKESWHDNMKLKKKLAYFDSLDILMREKASVVQQLHSHYAARLIQRAWRKWKWLKQALEEENEEEEVCGDGDISEEHMDPGFSEPLVSLLEVTPVEGRFSQEGPADALAVVEWEIQSEDMDSQKSRAVSIIQSQSAPKVQRSRGQSFKRQASTLNCVTIDFSSKRDDMASDCNHASARAFSSILDREIDIELDRRETGDEICMDNTSFDRSNQIPTGIPAFPNKHQVQPVQGDLDCSDHDRIHLESENIPSHDQPVDRERGEILPRQPMSDCKTSLQVSEGAVTIPIILEEDLNAQFIHQDLISTSVMHAINRNRLFCSSSKGLLIHVPQVSACGSTNLNENLYQEQKEQQGPSQRVNFGLLSFGHDLSDDDLGWQFEGDSLLLADGTIVELGFVDQPLVPSPPSSPFEDDLLELQDLEPNDLQEIEKRMYPQGSKKMSDVMSSATSQQADHARSHPCAVPEDQSMASIEEMFVCRGILTRHHGLGSSGGHAGSHSEGTHEGWSQPSKGSSDQPGAPSEGLNQELGIGKGRLTMAGSRQVGSHVNKGKTKAVCKGLSNRIKHPVAAETAFDLMFTISRASLVPPNSPQKQRKHSTKESNMVAQDRQAQEMLMQPRVQSWSGSKFLNNSRSMGAAGLPSAAMDDTFLGVSDFHFGVRGVTSQGQVRGVTSQGVPPGVFTTHAHASPSRGTLDVAELRDTPSRRLNVPGNPLGRLRASLTSRLNNTDQLHEGQQLSRPARIRGMSSPGIGSALISEMQILNSGFGGAPLRHMSVNSPGYRLQKKPSALQHLQVGLSTEELLVSNHSLHPMLQGSSLRQNSLYPQHRSQSGVRGEGGLSISNTWSFGASRQRNQQTAMTHSCEVPEACSLPRLISSNLQPQYRASDPGCHNNCSLRHIAAEAGDSSKAVGVSRFLMSSTEEIRPEWAKIRLEDQKFPLSARADCGQSGGVLDNSGPACLGCSKGIRNIKPSPPDFPRGLKGRGGRLCVGSPTTTKYHSIWSAGKEGLRPSPLAGGSSPSGTLPSLSPVSKGVNIG